MLTHIRQVSIAAKRLQLVLMPAREATATALPPHRSQAVIGIGRHLRRPL